jgi:hypothetical protein
VSLAADHHRAVSHADPGEPGPLVGADRPRVAETERGGPAAAARLDGTSLNLTTFRI